jgi:signal transduction histidine kinase/ActR/RegA family two-component response regulator
MYSVLDTLFEAAVIIDSDGVISYYNHHFTTLSKSSPRQIQKEKFLHELFTLEKEEIDRLMATAKATKAPQLTPELKVEVRGQDSEVHTIVLKVSPLEDSTYLVLFHDLTIENRLYEKYKLQLKELEKNHFQILQADKLSTIGEMTANISHEISNPLTVASGTLELVEALFEEQPDLLNKEVIQSCLDDIKDSHQRINAIMSNMKNFLYQSQSQREYTDLSEAIATSLQLMRSRLLETKVKVSFKKPSVEVVGLVDAIQIEQVIVNLIKNSVDSFEGRGGEITISISKKNNQHVIDFIDNGPGIKESEHERIFDAFFTTKKIGEGTGLGLAISQKILASHKGELVLVPSKVGAHFQIRLPCIELMSYTQNEFNSQRENEAGLRRVLVVDDEVKILNLLNSFVGEAGFVFIGSANPEDALEVVEQVSLDLIIVDYHMPVMSGAEFAAKVRAFDENVPILYMSATENQDKFIDDQSKLKLTGMITKPFTKDSVVSAISDALGGKLS